MSELPTLRGAVAQRDVRAVAGFVAWALAITLVSLFVVTMLFASFSVSILEVLG